MDLTSPSFQYIDHAEIICCEYVMVELRHLRYAIMVAEERHITRAAERLGIQQPPLSQQIRALEAEIGVALFRRLPRGVEPTAAGIAFVNRARDVLAEVDTAIDVARRVGRGEAGRLAIGFTGSAAFHPLVSATIGELRRNVPGLRLSLDEANSSDLVEAVRAGTLDAAFVRIPVPIGEGLTVLHLLDEQMAVALPDDHPLLPRWPVEQPLPLSDLSGEEFILYRRASGPGLYDAIIAACRKAGFSPHIAQEASQMIATVSLVSAGLGLSLLPAAMARLGAEGVAYRHLQSETAPVAPLSLIWRQGEESGPLARMIREVRHLTGG